MCWLGCGFKTPVYCWWECKMVKLLWKAGWWFVKKIKIELPYDSAIPFLCIYPKELKMESKEIL